MKNKLKEIMTDLAAGHITQEQADLLVNKQKTKSEPSEGQKKAISKNNQNKSKGRL